MFSCTALNHAVLRRAKELRAFYQLTEILPTDSSENMGSLGKQVVISGMLYILERDQLHPEAWAANYLNGRHELPVWAVVFNREEEELAEYAAMLAEARMIEIENDITVRLAEAA